jgi:hypothetical protein
VAFNGQAKKFFFVQILFNFCSATNTDFHQFFSAVKKGLFFKSLKPMRLFGNYRYGFSEVSGHDTTFKAAYRHRAGFFDFRFDQ